MSRLERYSRFLLLPALLTLPLALLVSSFLTFREFDEMKELYLRDRAAAVAARLETLTSEELQGDIVEFLSAEEPALVAVAIDSAGGNLLTDPSAGAIRAGQELFSAGKVEVNGETLYRVYLPFHSGPELRVARIDLDAGAADYLLAHARHNLVIVALSGLALILFSGYLVWSMRRTARFERRQAELEHLARLGKLSAVLAHEIRNPLGTIKGFAQLAGEKASPEVSSLLEPAVAEVGRLENLVNRLLEYGRPREPSFRLVEWEEIASELAIQVGAASPDGSIRFVRSGGSWQLRTDPDLLRQVLLNLVRNAAEALSGSGGGQIAVMAERDEKGRFVIKIVDDGPGLPDSVKDRLFEPFVTTKSTGTGMGLAIARKAAGSLGGRLELRDVKPHGTQAVLTFPNMDPKPSITEQAATWKQSS